MIIPSGVSHRAFWEQAKKSGIKINSRFRGVCLGLSQAGAPAWLAQVRRGGKNIRKRFEFTEFGERCASGFYEKKLNEIAKTNQPTT